MRQIYKVWQEEFMLVELSTSHECLLKVIAANPEATQTELSKVIELDASTIARYRFLKGGKHESVT